MELTDLVLPPQCGQATYPPADRIVDVHVTDLKVLQDDRGDFFEAIRQSDLPPLFGGRRPFGQVNVTMSHPGVIKAFHFHLWQWDFWTVLDGAIEVVMYDLRKSAASQDTTQKHVLSGRKPQRLAIPPGVAHGYRVLGQKTATLMYVVTKEFDLADPDEYRVPHDCPWIDAAWTTQPR